MEQRADVGASRAFGWDAGARNARPPQRKVRYMLAWGHGSHDLRVNWPTDVAANLCPRRYLSFWTGVLSGDGVRWLTSGANGARNLQATANIVLCVLHPSRGSGGS